jgi:glycosyltransferase involved in cell wall biosynthesis
VIDTFQSPKTIPEPPHDKTGWPWTDASEALPVCMPDGSPWPKISVVTPSFNQGQFIEETIRSVLLQNYPNLEFIIIDGGSTDNTLEIIKKYEPWLTYWVSEPDRGQSHAVNKGIQRASGEIVHWLNSDDLLLPGALAIVSQQLQTHPAARLIIGQARVINSKGEITGDLKSQFRSWKEAATSPRNTIRQVSSFFTRTLFYELGMIDETLHIAMDSELLIRFTRYHDPLIIEDYLTAFRVQPNAKTSSQLLYGYTETDRRRPGILPNKQLKKKFKEQSARNWLGLSELETYTYSERWKCILKAVKQFPRVLVSRRFWISIKRIMLN